MYSSLTEFIWKYLAGPIVADAQNASTATWSGIVAETGYNIFNTIAWASIALCVAYGFYKLFERLDISFDLETTLFTLPYVLLGGLLRYLEDTGIIPFPFSIMAITPVIYVVVALVYLTALLISYRFRKDRLDYSIGLFGGIFLVPVLIISLIQAINLGLDLAFISYSLGIAVFLTSVFYLYIRQTDFNTIIYTLAGFSQFFGGTVSMLSVVNGGTQKQLLAQTSTEIFGPAGILIVKAGVLIAAIHVLKDVEDVKTEALVLLGLIVIGLATGLRVMMRMATGV